MVSSIIEAYANNRKECQQKTKYVWKWVIQSAFHYLLFVEWKQLIQNIYLTSGNDSLKRKSTVFQLACEPNLLNEFENIFSVWESTRMRNLISIYSQAIKTDLRIKWRIRGISNTTQQMEIIELLMGFWMFYHSCS